MNREEVTYDKTRDNQQTHPRTTKVIAGIESLYAVEVQFRCH